MPTRRRFLQAALLGSAASALTANAGEANPEPASVIDTHTHFYDPTRPEGVPWPAKDDKLLYRRVLPADFQQATKGIRIAGTVVVEASPRVEDNQWLLDLAGKNTIILGVVGNLAPASDDFAKHLDRFRRDARFRGIRINHADVRKGLEQRRFRDAMGLLAKNDLELDVNGGPDMPADIARLARAFRDLRIVINHAANVRIDGKAPPDAWRRGLRAVAAERNVWCKVSALVEGTGRDQGNAPRELAHYRPVLDALWDTFGENRLIYGSNWPVSERFATYATVYAIVRDFFRTKGQAALDKFFARNAADVYKWPKR